MNQEKEGIVQKKFGEGTNAFERYRRIVVGEASYLHLLAYELINMTFLPVRGTTGHLLRKYSLPLILGHTGAKLKFGSNCTIRNGRKISIGNKTVIDDEVTLDVKPGNKKLIIGNRVRIGKRTIFNCSGGIVEVGEGTEIAHHCRLGSLKGLSIGRFCRIEGNCCLSGASHSFSRTDIPIIDQPLTCKGPTVIGDFVKIGTRVTILDGVKIGNNVTILEDSLVNRDIDEGLVASGVPAKIVQ